MFAAIAGWVTGTLIPNAMSLWETMQAVWNGIGAVISYVYDNFIAPALRNFELVANIVGAVVMALWQAYVEPAFNAIGAIISAVWSGVIEPVFGFFRAGVGLVGDAISAFWTGVVEPVFGWIGDKISAVWNNTVSPIFDLMKKGVDLLGDAFGKVGDIIAGAWDTAVNGIKAAANIIGALLLKIPLKLGPFEIPGASAAHDLGNKLVSLRDGGLFRGRGGPATTPTSYASPTRNTSSTPPQPKTPCHCSKRSTPDGCPLPRCSTKCSPDSRAADTYPPTT